MLFLQLASRIEVMGSEDHVKPRWKSSPGRRAIAVIVISVVVFFVTFTAVVDVRNSKWGDSATSTTRLAIKSPKYSDCVWKPEPLHGPCDVTKSTEASRAHLTAEDCEKACCESKHCVTFQFRARDGCLWGGDTRLGGEKDGPSAWCEPRPPAAWHGQWIKVKGKGDAIPGACTNEGWDPKELNGQCFGLGSKKTTSSNIPEACRDACCANENCFVWQWRSDAGCFFNDNAFNCQEANPQDFAPFVGKRKVQEGRSYSPPAYSGDFANMAESVRRDDAQ